MFATKVCIQVTWLNATELCEVVNNLLLRAYVIVQERCSFQRALSDTSEKLLIIIEE